MSTGWGTCTLRSVALEFELCECIYVKSYNFLPTKILMNVYMLHFSFTLKSKLVVTKANVRMAAAALFYLREGPTACKIVMSS